jgi:hypothetical protein
MEYRAGSDGEANGQATIKTIFSSYCMGRLRIAPLFNLISTEETML